MTAGVAQAQDNVVTDTNLTSLNLNLRAAQTNGGTVVLDVDGTFTLTNTLTITKNILIEAGSNRTVSISGGNAVRVFTVSRNAVLTLMNVGVVNGRSATGGGIYNDGGTVVALGCSFVGNVATNMVGANGRSGDDGHPNGDNGGAGGNAAGGAIYSSGMLEVYCSLFTNNAVWGGNGGNGGNGATNPSTFAGSGGDGGNGGSASGGAIHIADGTSEVGWCLFEFNTVEAGFGGIPGIAGPGGIYGDGGKGGAGNAAAGAGIYNGGKLRIFSSLFVNNSAYGGSAAGVLPRGDGTSRDALSGGAAFGGAIYNIGQVGMTNCTVAGNICQGGAGGNIASSAQAKAGNGGDACGGGLATSGNASIADMVNCTFALNALYGGTNGVNAASNFNGVMGRDLGGNLFHSGGVLKVRNSILDEGGGTNLNSYGGVTDGGYNLSSDTSCQFTAAGSVNKLSPKLGTTLEYIDPPTNSPSIAITRPGTTDVAIFDIQPAIPGLSPQPGSPAINAIPTDASHPDTDQRGFSRPQGSKVDIGAIEVEEANLAPTIIQQPVGITHLPDTNITLSVQAAGELPLSYQWSVNNFAIINETNSTLPIKSAQQSDSGAYSVTINNRFGLITSSNAIVQIMNPVTLGGIDVYNAIASSRVLIGIGATISISPSGSGPFSYLWYYNGKVLTNQTGDSILIANVQPTNAGTYAVVVSNAVSWRSNSVTISVHSPASIVTQPTNQKLLLGTNAIMSIVASGEKPIYYQWVWNGKTYKTTNNSTCQIANAQTQLTNSYFVMLSNQFNTAWVTSSVAQVTFYSRLGITNQSSGGTVNFGGDTKLWVDVSSEAGNVTYQWYRNKLAISDATNSALSITNARTANAGTYMAKVSDAVSHADSSDMVLKIGTPPKITSQPSSGIISDVTKSVVLQVSATPTNQLQYQWYANDSKIPGETNSKYSTANAGTYWVTVTDAQGNKITSSKAILVLKVMIKSLSIATQTNSTGNISQAVATGTNVTLQVLASGDPTRFQWYRNGVALAGQTNSTLFFGAVRKSDAAVYRVTAANQLSSASSSNATLKVLDLPTLATTPQSLTNLLGSKLTLRTTVRGDGPFSCQWWFQSNTVSSISNVITNTTSTNFTISKVAASDAGLYSVVVTNPVGTVTGNVATVKVITPPPVITAPATKQVSTKQITLIGTAYYAVTNVVVLVNDVSTNVSTTGASSTNVKWSAIISLAPGTNFISAVAQASCGDSTAAKAECFYKTTFSPDPYAAKTGTYFGLFYDTNDTHQFNSGALNLALKETGIFSGKLLQGTNAYPLSGQFDELGHAYVRSGTSAVRINLDFENSPTNKFFGVVTGWQWTNSQLQANRVVYSSSNTAPMAGKYTLAFPGENSVDGDGVLTLQVDRASGTVIAIGTLADGAAVSGAGTVCAGGQWPMYLSANNGQGSFFGWLTFEEATNLTGNATWICPSSQLFTNGLVRTAEVLASPYRPPTNGTFAVGLQTGLLTLTGGNLPDTLTTGISLSTNNVFSVDSTNLTLRLNPTNGLVTGSFRDTNAHTIDPIYGIILKNQSTVRGCFIGTNQSGRLRIVRP